jgi:hypothetical protein
LQQFLNLNIWLVNLNILEMKIQDVMEDDELKFGPNGGLVFSMEFLIENSEWLEVSQSRSSTIMLYALILNKLNPIPYPNLYFVWIYNGQKVSDFSNLGQQHMVHFLNTIINQSNA